jgi:hypothetical protein
MPIWLRVIADWNPMSAVVAAARELSVRRYTRAVR